MEILLYIVIFALGIGLTLARIIIKRTPIGNWFACKKFEFDLEWYRAKNMTE